MSKYVVCGNYEFYPWVYEFDDLETAREKFEQVSNCDEDVFLCEIIGIRREDPGEVVEIFELSREGLKKIALSTKPRGEENESE